ncbi:AMP-binding protein [Sporomusa sp.]|uniref:AMP-binding protein n=1 Tax=Sporomusa sp. TaxID=2078658 RepID=UPI002C096177|nr:AMP-binding protein [Sporomusa sp.]HWR05861.1 AMP-binding protein [Sporomusa sp.]
MRTILRWLLQLLFRTRVIGRERFQFSGPSIIMPNHVSFLDAIFLYAYLPREVYFVVNTTIAARISFILQWVNHTTVDPLSPYSVKKIVGVIKAGHPVVLFPEGRITTTGNLMKIYSGVGFIALKTGAFIQPVIFRGPERSRLSRMKTKVKTQWFPQVTIYVASREQLLAAAGQSFRLQKREISDRILRLLQQTMFQARQQQDKTTNLFDKLLAAGQIHGMGKDMAEDIGGTVSYRQAIISSYALGAKLQPLLPGEHPVGVLLPNSIGHLLTLFALFCIGKTPAILNFSAGAENNLDCAETAGVKKILTSRAFIAKGHLEELAARLSSRFELNYLEDSKQQIGLADRLSALYNYLTRQTARGDAALILFTSGSESKPKGVVLRHTNILANLNQIASVIDYTPGDKMLNALPMFHSFGLTAGTLLPVLSGVQVFLYPTPLHYKAIPEIAYDRNVTLLLGTPTFLHGYAKAAHHYDFYNLRYVPAGGEKLNDEVRSLWQEKFGVRIFEGYGTTETAPVLSLNTPLFSKPGTVGKFLPGIEWRTEEIPGISEGGNLFVKGPNVMAGYLLHGRGFVPAPEWYDCGDMVSIDEAGFVRIRSRLKRFAKISGEMVSLDAVEKAAESCFGTDRNAAINLPDAKKGEKVILYTMHKAASKQLLREFMSKTRQSMLAMPAAVIVVDKLPLLGSGKIDYVTLKGWGINEVKKDA